MEKTNEVTGMPPTCAQELFGWRGIIRARLKVSQLSAIECPENWLFAAIAERRR